MINTQFSSLKLGATQPNSAVNAVQQTSGWCEVCGNSGHSVAMCTANLESVMYVVNAQRQTMRMPTIVTCRVSPTTHEEIIKSNLSSFGSNKEIIQTLR